MEVTDGNEATANFRNTYALRSLELSKDMFTEQGKPYLAENELPEDTAFTFTLDASQDVTTFLYKITSGSPDGVEINGNLPVLKDKENVFRLNGQELEKQTKLYGIKKKSLFL